MARLLGDSLFEIVFIDGSKELVDQINAEGGYRIHFFGGKRSPYAITGVRAAIPESEEALDWMTRATAIFTAVGEQNMVDLIPFLRRTLDRRRQQNGQIKPFRL